MKISQVQFLLLIAFTAILLSAYITYKSGLEKRQNAQLLINTESTIQTATEILSLLTEAETGQRGYIITGDTSYLDPYFNALHNVEDRLEDLKKLLDNDSLQLGRLRLLQKKVGNKIDELNYTVGLFNTKGVKATMEMIKSKRIKVTLDDSRKIIADIIEDEKEILLIRTAKLEKSFVFNDQIRYVSFSFIGFMLVVALLNISRKEKKIDTLIVSLNTTNKNLESEVKKRTEELQEANQELHAANEELTTVNDQLNLLNEDKNKFIGMAAHDLKSPINSIKGLVELFQMDADNLNDEQLEYLKYMSESSSRMLHLISDILNVNRIETGKNTLKAENFNIYYFVQNIVFGLKITAEKKNIKIFLYSNDEDFIIKSDKNTIAQIVENLISNAVKFSPANKNVYVNILKTEGRLAIEVRDEGLGIRKDELPLLFNKFKRLSTRPTAGEDSTGLGLSIVKGLVEMLNGDIFAESEEGKGAKFTVEIPVDKTIFSN